MRDSAKNMVLTPKLRCHPLVPPLHVVLIEPEIPPNTGAIARTCAATQSPLHLVGQLGFRIDAHSVRRAGLDYWHLVQVHRHTTFEAFRQTQPNANIHLYSAKATRPYWEAPLKPGDALVFGKESVGLSDDFVAAYPDNVWAIPTSGAVRSLNLSNAVSVILFDALRHVGSMDDLFMA